MPRPRFNNAAAPSRNRAAPRIRRRSGVAGIPRAGRNRRLPDFDVVAPAIIPAARDPSPEAQRAPSPPLPLRRSPPARHPPTRQQAQPDLHQFDELLHQLINRFLPWNYPFLLNHQRPTLRIFPQEDS